jgi:hypothetical protein
MASSGMGSTKQVVIDFQILDKDAVANIQQLNTKIENLKKTMQNMRDAGQQNSAMYIELNAALKEMEGTVRQNQKLLVAGIQQQKANGDSINAYRAQLKQLRAEYEEMSEAERTSAQGTDLLNHIQEVTDKLSGLEQGQRDFSRQVGDYAKALTGIDFSKFVNGMKNMSGGVTTLGGAFKQGIAGVKAFGASLKALMKIPIVAIISAIALVVMKLVDSFKKNDAAMTAVKKSMALLKPPLQLLEKLFQVLTKAITAVMDALTKVGNAIMSLIPGLKDMWMPTMM